MIAVGGSGGDGMRLHIGVTGCWWTLLFLSVGERDYRGVWSGCVALAGLVIEWEL
jgi:hypothetical protein